MFDLHSCGIPSVIHLCLVLQVGSFTLLNVDSAADTAHKNMCDYRKTCGGLEYDSREAQCCENELHPGPRLSCCGRKAYDPASATCCTAAEQGSPSAAVITAGLSQIVSWCCGLQAYDPLNQICCDSTVIDRPVPMAKCCGKGAFDEETQLCCSHHHNKTILKKVSDNHMCCGQALYNNRTHCCYSMDKRPQIQPLQSIYCAQKSELNSNTNLARKSSHQQSCGPLQFDNKTECCCWTSGIHFIEVKRVNCCSHNSELNSNTNLARKSSHQQSCGPLQFDQKTECCCWTSGIHFIEAKRMNCCSHNSGASLQAPLPPPVRAEPSTSLCGSSRYSPKESQCCERTKTTGPWCCQAAGCGVVPTVYNPRTKICCDGCLSDRNPWTDKCCGETPFGFAQRRVLCCKNTLYTDREDEDECSDVGIPYNPTKGTVCCSQFHATPGQHCCGTQTYQPSSEICCDGHRHPNVENNRCCGIHAYNFKDPEMKCCRGALHNLTSSGKLGSDAKCCEFILQTKHDVCCASGKEEVLYSIKRGFKCCGHHYYNTSLWSCCTGKLTPVDQTGRHVNRVEAGSKFLSVDNLDKNVLCEGIKVGTVDSVSLDSVTFSNVLEIHGAKGSFGHLPFTYTVSMPDRCNMPKLILGKAYFFNEESVFTAHNVEKTIYQISSKCYDQ